MLRRHRHSTVSPIETHDSDKKAKIQPSLDNDPPTMSRYFD